MMEITLIINKNEFQMISGVNIADELYFAPAAVMAQNESLKNILGSKFVDDVSNDVSIIAEELLDYIKMFLIFSTAVNYINITSNKTSNFGVSEASDSYLNASYQRQIKAETFFQTKADGYARKIQRFVLAHIDEYRELLSDCICERIRANLHSYASSGIWLGGIRY